MPVYRYRCEDCGKNFEKRLTYAEFDSARPDCPGCGSLKVTRRINRVRTIQSDQFRIFTEAAEKAESPDTDSRALGRMMREMKAESGAKVAPEYDEVAGRLESGESMDSIDASFSDD